MKVILTLAALIALAYAVTLWKAARHEARAEAEFPPQGDFVEVDGHPVHYIDRGEGPPLVLIHGASGNLRDFTFSLVDRLAAEYRVIAFDRPGLGYTPRINKTGASITQQADLLARAAAQLGVEKPLVLGHSYGGAVALAWAVNRPEDLSALVLVAAPSLPWSSGLSAYYRVLSNPVLGPLAIPVLTAWVPDGVVETAVESVFDPQNAPDGYRDHIGAPLTLRRDSLRANALQRAQLLEQIEALAPRYEEIAVPIELVHGTADTTVGVSIHSRPLTERLGNAHLAELEGIGHMPHHNREAAVIEAIRRAAERAGLR